MISRRRFAASMLSSVAATPIWLRAQASRPVTLLLVTGQNNHDWRRTSPILSSLLTASGRFDVSVTTTPLPGASDADWRAWRPAFATYDGLVLDYNGEPWPDPIKRDFEQYVSNGGGVLNVHASNNPFPGWAAFEEMTGLLWRPKTAGPTMFLDEAGRAVTVPAGEDRDASHGVKHDFVVTIRDTAHPVTQGMPIEWLHPFDELYHAQRGPAKNIRVLATAFSDPAASGTGRHELMVWWIPYGRGRVLTCLLGHLWPNQKETDALRCVGFRTLVQRSAEWIATGRVTIPIPSTFPARGRKSIVE